MAKVELMPAIKSISGKVGKMSNARFTFGTIAVEVARRMADGDTRPRKTIWAEVKRSLAKKKK